MIVRISCVLIVVERKVNKDLLIELDAKYDEVVDELQDIAETFDDDHPIDSYLISIRKKLLIIEKELNMRISKLKRYK